ncbi:hypothetical protein FRC10_007074, partial [Ceratobasidium sp. 414]
MAPVMKMMDHLMCSQHKTWQTVLRYVQSSCNKYECCHFKLLLALKAVVKLSKAKPHHHPGKCQYHHHNPPTSPSLVPQHKDPARLPLPADEPMPPADNVNPFAFNNMCSEHSDFHFDTPGAGLSGSHDTTPVFIPHLIATKAQPPLTLQDADWWVEGLTTAEMLSHKLSEEMVHNEGFKLSKEDLLLIEAFNYKVSMKIS